MALKLNIKTFDELGYSMIGFDSFVETYDECINRINPLLENNHEALEVFKSASGARRLSDNTRNIIATFNEIIDLSADYFDSCVEWSRGTVEALNSVLGDTREAISGTTVRDVLNNIEEKYSDYMVGAVDPSHVNTYVQSLLKTVEELVSAINSVTDSVVSNRTAFPDDIYNSFSNTVSNNNDAIREAVNRVLNYMAEHIDEFCAEISGAVNDSATAARGTNI